MVSDNDRLERFKERLAEASKDPLETVMFAVMHNSFKQLCDTEEQKAQWQQERDLIEIELCKDPFYTRALKHTKQSESP